MMKPVSKGKWLPGSLKSLRQSHGLGYSFYCEVCDRGFPTQISFEKHSQTEMHFKRVSKAGVSGIISECDQLADTTDRLPSQRARRSIEIKKYYPVDRKRTANVDASTESDQIRCPTCFALFNRNMMGKHLLSYFHCQKSERAGRRADPEKSLILDNIHSIVSLSPYQCKPCKFYFTKRSQLLEHFEKKHSGSEESNQKNVSYGWICSACCRTTKVTDAAGMLKHLKHSLEHEKMEAAIQKSIPIIIKNVKLRKCKHCQKVFLLRRECLSHELNFSMQKGPENGSAPSKPNSTADSEEFKLQLVQTIDAAGNTEENLQERPGKLRKSKRISSLELSRDAEFKCEKCTFTSRSQAHLLRHSKVHESQRAKQFICDVCGAGFYEKFQLNFHLKIHSGKTVKCSFPTCDFHGRSLSEVKAHFATHSKSDKEIQFRCDLCGYTSASKAHLNRHIKSVHEKTEEKQFKCKKCSYQTNLFHGLKRHELTHEDEKIFHCPHCEYTAKNIETLRIHVLRTKIHPDAFLYSCTLCSRNHSAATNKELLSKDLNSSVFRTNKYSEFKAHVQRQHSDNPWADSDQGIYVLAGLRKDWTNNPEESLTS